MHDDRSPDEGFSQWADAASDRDLLAEFVRESDERAYSEIVRRHSTLVLGVCRRVLRDRHAAEDAFQATFLVLARSAHSIRKQRSLASWLHRVAYRISMRALAESHRRKEQAVPMETVTSPAELRDVGELYEQQLLDEELQDLPEKYREPLVLHHLQGMSQQQVAERLGMTISAVDGRLKRGRKELKLRLVRRGVEFGSVVAAMGLCQSAASAASIEPLIALATQSALAATSGTAIPSTVSSQAASLAGKELTIMSASSKLVTTLGVSAVLVTLIGLTAGSAAPGTEPAFRETIPQLSTVADAPITSPHGGGWLVQADVEESVPHNSDSEDEAGSRRPLRSPTLDYSRSDPSTERIEAALDEVTDIAFRENPIGDVVDYISQVHNIPILFDLRSLQDYDISPDDEVTLVVGDIQLRSALELLLKDVSGEQLDYVIQNEVLTITTRKHADSVLETRVYNLRYLAPTYTPEDVARVVRSIRPWTWLAEDASLQSGMGVGADDAGHVDITVDQRFFATVEPLPDAIVVTQSQRIHREIVDLLEQLHRGNPVSPTTANIEAAINEQLDQPVEWEFVNLALAEALRLLSVDCGVNIVLDKSALELTGISASEEVSIVLSGITLRSALRILLSDVGGVELTYVIEDEVIKVTTPAVSADNDPGVEATSTGQPATAPGATPSRPVSEPISDVSIRGVIRVQGEVPVLPPVAVAGELNFRDAGILEEDIPNESLIVGGSNELANVFVWIDRVPDGVAIPPPPSDPPMIESKGIRFFPHTLITRAGQAIEVTNYDEIPISVHTYPIKNSPSNSLLAPGGETLIEFSRSEPFPFRLADDIHPYRDGYLLPLDHPFADLTDTSGQFNIRQLPPGEYELNIWHERGGYLQHKLPITVPEDGPAEFDLDVDVEDLLGTSGPM